MPALSRFADHAVLWATVSAGLWASGRRPAQRAARRGLISLGLTSLLVNAIAKRVLPRDRPPLEAVPVVRRALRRPTSGSFPSGHAASAAAYATAASHALPVLTVPLVALAASVGYSRVFTGVHYPGDVLFGAAIGTAVGTVVNRLAPLRTPEPVRTVEPLAAPQPPRPDGAGVVMVVNPSSGAGRAVRVAEEMRAQLPEMDVVMLTEGEDLTAVLRQAAARAQVLGITGGDGSVSAAARVAIETGLPLVVAPGGTFNHFAADLGASQAGEVVRAIREGAAIRTDVGVIRDASADPATPDLAAPAPAVNPFALDLTAPDPTAPDGAGHAAGTGASLLHVFVNTASLAAYPSFVAARERWEPRLGKNLAAVVAVWSVLRTEQPLRATLNGRAIRIAMLFIGNGRYQPYGFVPAWRPRLDDGILDLRIVEAGRWLPVTRMVASLMTGRLGRSRLYTEVGSAGIDVHLPEGPTRLAWDGEIGPGPAQLRFEVARLALTVYRPSGSSAR